MRISPIIAQDSNRQNTFQLTNQATKLYQLRNWTEAAASWQEAEKMFLSQGDKLNRAMALSNLSLTYQQLGEWKEATEVIQESIGILEEQPYSEDRQLLLSQSLDVQGKLLQEIGQYNNALETWQQAREIHLQIGDRDRLIQNQINQAEAMQYLGYNPLACKTLLQALDLEYSECTFPTENQTLFSKPSSSVQAKALFSLADVLRATGNVLESKEIIEQTLQSKTKISPSIQSKALFSLAKTERVLGEKAGTRIRSLSIVDDEEREKLETEAKNNIKNALDYYEQAITKSKDSLFNSQVLLEKFNLLIDLNRYQEAESLLSSINNYSSRSRLNSQSIYTQVNLAKSLVLLHQKQSNSQDSQSGDKLLSEAKQLLENAIHESQEIKDTRAESYAYGSLGELYKYKQKNTQAQKYTNQALKLGQTSQAKELEYLWAWQLARLEKDSSKAIEYYDYAYTILNDIRTDLVTLNPEIRFSFRKDIEPIYREYVNLLLQSPQPSQTNLQKAREVIEALQLAELDNFFQDTCIEGQPVNIDHFDPNAAIFYSIILPDRLEVIVAFPGEDLPNRKLHNHKIDLSRDEIKQKIDELIPKLSKPIYGRIDEEPPSEPEFLPLLQEFYSWFIDEIEQELSQKKIKTLVFISDSLLRNIPPASFHNGEQYLIEEYSIAIAPSLQLTSDSADVSSAKERASLTEPKFLDRQQTQVFIAGISEANGDVYELPAVTSEIDSIQKTFPTDVLLNDLFSRENFTTEVQSLPYQIVHIATHGQFSSQTEDTFIWAWEEKIKVNELANILRSQQLQTDQPIELLVLSACETAQGDEFASLGIAGVAVRAGARSTIASLWAVSDKPTMELMTYFYEELAKGNVSKAEALRQAQIKILQHEKVLYRQPYFWSAFILVGNWL